MRESKIEKGVGDYATAKGVLNYKFVSPSASGVPDRLFLYKGRAMFIEFKSARGRVSVLQQYHRDNIQAHDVRVHIVDSIGKGQRIVDMFKHPEAQ